MAGQGQRRDERMTFTEASPMWSSVILLPLSIHQECSASTKKSILVVLKSLSPVMPEGILVHVIDGR